MRLPSLKSLFGYLILSLVVYSMLSAYGCSSGPSEPGEGRIVYTVTIEGDDVDPMMKTMMPSEITTHFKGSATATVISMGMGMMETRMISDATSRNYSTLVSAMGKKVAMVMSGDLVEKNYADRVPLKVRFTGDKKQIAGVDCIKAVITDSTNNSYEVYYTEDLGTADYNWSTPYKEIRGMLMDYSIRFDNVVMKLTAKEIIREPNDSTIFSVPADYQIITDPNEMGAFF